MAIKRHELLMNIEIQFEFENSFHDRV